MKLVICSGCGRHVKEGATACPFCGETVSTAPTASGSLVVRRVSRAALLGSAGMLALADCSAAALYGVCPPPDVSIEAPCGFLAVTTTCAGVTPLCASDQGSCIIGPITNSNNCTVSVLLGDHTTHTVAVTVSRCPIESDTLTVSPEFTDLTSTTCQALPDAGVGFGDGGPDAGTDAIADALMD